MGEARENVGWVQQRTLSHVCLAVGHVSSQAGLAAEPTRGCPAENSEMPGSEDWQCEDCTLLNPPSAAKCAACDADRPMLPPMGSLDNAVDPHSPYGHSPYGQSAFLPPTAGGGSGGSGMYPPQGTQNFGSGDLPPQGTMSQYLT